MSDSSIGHIAENIAADYLKKSGFTVVELNWRTLKCEIDIVAKKHKIAYLVEVKYRHSDNWGDGVDAITDAKHKQMIYAADIWAHSNQWVGDYRLMVIAMTDMPPRVVRMLELD